MISETIDKEALAFSEAMAGSQDKVATAESCTGGLVAAALTAVAGASAWFDRGFVTYTNASKHELLGVGESVFERYGAVSAECVSAMLQGVFKHSKADIAVAISGIAGPGGAVPGKPVGTVFIGVMRRDEMPFVRRCQFDGDRSSVRDQAVCVALADLRELIISAE